MAENAKQPAHNDKQNGLFVRGVVMSSTAKSHKRKDGTGVFVILLLGGLLCFWAWGVIAPRSQATADMLPRRA